MKKTIWISNLASFVFGSLLGARCIEKKSIYHVDRLEKDISRLYDISEIMTRWVKLYQRGKGISNYFVSNNYKKVAIYGLNEMGYMLVDELEKTKEDIELAYCIDRNAENMFTKTVEVVPPTKSMGEVDVIVVTAVQYYDEIKRDLSSMVTCPIVSFMDVVMGC